MPKEKRSEADNVVSLTECGLEYRFCDTLYHNNH